MSSLKKLLVLFVIVIIAIGISGCRKRGGGSSKQTIELTYYKLFDDEDTLKPLIQEYEKAHPKVKIKYKKFTDIAEYEELIINELAEGEGPDIFELHNTWVPRHMKKVVPFVSDVLTPEVYENTFVKVAADDFIQVDPRDGVAKIYGIPLAVDTLALYYNKAYFDRYIPEAGKPSISWDGIQEQVVKLTQKDKNNSINIAGIAFGRSDNIAVASDILYALFLQYGTDFYDNGFKRAAFASDKGSDALTLFTSFAESKRKQYSWSKAIVSPESDLKEVEAFLTGKTAMIVGYASLYDDFEVMIKNLRAQGNDVISTNSIRVAPLPQVAEAEESFKTYASYFGQTVSRTSAYPNTAWDFIQFLASKESAKKYMVAAKRPTSRRDLIDEQKRDPVYGVFVQQLGYAESIPIYHARKFKEFFDSAVNEIVDEGANPSQALSDAQKFVNAILPEEGIYPPVEQKKK